MNKNLKWVMAAFAAVIVGTMGFAICSEGSEGAVTETFTTPIPAFMNVQDQGDVYYTINCGDQLQINERSNGGPTAGPGADNRKAFVTSAPDWLGLVSGDEEGKRVWRTSDTLGSGTWDIPMKLTVKTVTYATKTYTLHLTVRSTVTFDYNGGSGDTPSATSSGESIVLPGAAKSNAVFDGWYTSKTGGTLVGGSGASWVPDRSQTLYAHYIDNSVQFLRDGVSIVATDYTLHYNGYLEYKFQTDPNTATVSVATNPLGVPLTVSRSGNTVTVSGSISDVLPGQYGVIIRATAPGYSAANLSMKVDINTAIIEPIDEQIYIGQSWFHSITTIPASAQIQWGQSTIKGPGGQPLSGSVDYILDQSSRSFTFQALREGIFYINLVVSAPGYSPATKQIILNAAPMTDISQPPSASGITATPNTQVDGGWYFTVNDPQNYHDLRWDFGDGTDPSSETSVTHQYQRNGTFTVTCTLWNRTANVSSQVSTQVSVVLTQQVGLDAWVDTPYSYAVPASGTDAVTMSTDIDQSWLSVMTFTDDGGIRYVKVYSDTGPVSALAGSDLTVTLRAGSSVIATYTIHIWPKLGDAEVANPGQYGVSISIDGMTVTITHTGSKVASYTMVSWGDGHSARVPVASGGTHTYSEPGSYTIHVDYNGNGGGAIGRATAFATVPSNSVEYTIYYNGNGGAGSIPSSTGQQIAVANNTFVREGYTFRSWNTSPAGNGTTFVPGSLINGLTADITLYAIWSGGNGGGEDSKDDGGNWLRGKTFGIAHWTWIPMIVLALIVIIAILREVSD